MKALVFALIFAIGFGVCVQADAAMIGLTPSFPDITTGFIDVSYDSTTHVFAATGYSGSIELTGTPPPDVFPSGYLYSITASIDNAGVVHGGTFNISGTITGSPVNTGTLLTGSLTQFGFNQTGGDIFEFVFDVTGGDLAGFAGHRAGVILDAQDTGFTGSFASSFSNGDDGIGVSDTFPVPEPATICLLLLGAAMTAVRRHRRAVK